ncbi:MAG: DUF3060 domain-containing protein [Cystobacter sp.]
MLKNIRAAALVLVVGWGAVGVAAPKADTRSGVKIDAGGTLVDIKPGSDVSVRLPGAEIQAASRNPATSSKERVVEVREGRISLMGHGQTQTVTCAHPRAEVWVGGTSNNYVIEGDCKYISVSGSSNRVRVESLGRVDVTGSGNLILWKHGLANAPIR